MGGFDDAQRDGFGMMMKGDNATGILILLLVHILIEIAN